MKKIIFCNITMKTNIEKISSKNGSGKAYCFPISEIFDQVVSSDDSVDIVMLGTDGTDVSSNANYQLLMDELNDINKNINCKMEFHKVECDFEETPDAYFERLKGIIKYFQEDAICISDITFGPRTLSIVLFNALIYGEKFFNMDIQKIIYRKVEFAENNDGKFGPINPEICDITSLYTFGNMFHSMPNVSPEKASSLLTKILKKS